MTLTLTQQARRGAQWALTTPLKAALTHGNQALVTLASAYMNAQFAQSHNILDPWIAWLLAAGYEWTYLRGVASSERTQSKWTAGLNGVAFFTAIIGGLLYCADRYGALPAKPDATLAWFLAAAHVLPMALLSLCSAMVHRAASAGEVASQEARRKAELELAIERERKEQDLVLWERGQRMVAALDAEKKRRNADARKARMPMRRDALPASMDAALKICPKCSTTLSQAQWLAARRWGHCASCKEAK